MEVSRRVYKGKAKDFSLDVIIMSIRYICMAGIGNLEAPSNQTPGPEMLFPLPELNLQNLFRVRGGDKSQLEIRADRSPLCEPVLNWFYIVRVRPE